MRKFEFGNTLQLLGNIGVIIGILLLVYELNQNRDMMRAQTRNELNQGLIQILLANQSDSEIASIRLRGNRGEDLTELESARYRTGSVIQLRYHENSHYQYRSGLYDETEFFAQREQWKIVFSGKGMADSFCEFRPGLSPAFVAEIEGLLTTYKCE